VKPASTRAEGLPRSAIREIMILAAGRPEVIHLEVGEPDAATPLHIIEGAFEAARKGWTRYAPNAGLPSLRKRVAARAKVTEDRIVITTGAVGGLFSALMSVLDPGDEILIPDPGWPNYAAIAHLAGAEVVRFPMPASRGFLPDMADIRRLTTAKTKAILVNTPGNPTGALFPPRLMQELVEHVRANGLYLVSDEVYEDMVFEGEHVSAGSFGAEENMFIVTGASKSFAMTGWRLGWLVCPPQLAGVATALQEPTTSCASTISQKAGEAALDGGEAAVRDLCAKFKRRRDLAVEILRKYIPVVPAGAFYAFVDISHTGQDSLKFCKRLLAEKSVAAVPGITFGPQSDRYIRIAFTINDADLRKGLERIAEQLG